MWKEDLPKNCPPRKALEKDIQVYRILKSDAHQAEDFKNYLALYPDNPRYKEICKAYALSFYDSVENAKLALQKYTTLEGTHIGEYKLNKDHGVCNYADDSGHYSIWFYETWDFNTFTPINISSINEH